MCQEILATSSPMVESSFLLTSSFSSFPETKCSNKHPLTFSSPQLSPTCTGCAGNQTREWGRMHVPSSLNLASSRPDSILIFTARLKSFLSQLPFSRLLSLLLRHQPQLSHTALHKRSFLPSPPLPLDQEISLGMLLGPPRQPSQWLEWC